jgi:hypothetical protein
MNLLRLIESVVVFGRDIFGRMARIKFSPLNLPGWHWKCGSEVIPITSDIASYNPRRITLRYKDHLLEIYEHIGALRWTGLDGVLIEASKFPPYHGRIAELWHALRPFCEETDRSVPWVRLDKICTGTVIGNRDRSVSLSPADHKLAVAVILEIKGLGEKTFSCELPMLLDEVFEAHTLGWPSRLFHFSRLAGLLGWPHHKHIEWAQENSCDGLLEKTCLHRTGDLLGALSLITHDHLVSGRVVSNRGGHRIDMDLLRRIGPI